MIPENYALDRVDVSALSAFAGKASMQMEHLVSQPRMMRNCNRLRRPHWRRNHQRANTPPGQLNGG